MSVSVVIPTYERPAFLRGAIETALEQTYEEIEVIVVDDGSSERYAQEVVGEYSDDVCCITHEKNKGLSAARNTGVRESHGDYIAFLDDDDRWHRTKIARQVHELNQNEAAGLVTCLVVAITPENDVVYCERTAPYGDCLEDLLVRNVIGTPSRVLVRREALEETCGFDGSLPTKQDWDFYIRLAREWDIAVADEHLCFKTVHESMSSSVEALQRDKSAILEKHGDLIRERGQRDRARAALHEEVGRTYLDDGDFRLAREHLRKAASLKATKRGLVLLGLTYTPRAVFQATVTAKRSLSSFRSDCPDISTMVDEIPGLQNPTSRS